jgi:hypothetical protein
VGPPPPLTFDVAGLVSRADIILTKPNTQNNQYMPLGNGTLGVAGWAANGFTAQLNRGDTLPNRLSPGQVLIPGLSKLVNAPDFAGYLDLYQGMLIESGGGMTMTAYVRADAPELVVDVTGADPNSMQTAQVELWSGRSPKALAGNSVAILAETWIDNSGNGASGATFGSLAAITAGARNVATSVLSPLVVQVAFQPNSDGSFRVVVASPTWTGGDAMSTAASVLGSDATTASAMLSAGHLAWWQDYWGRIGMVKMTSNDGNADYFEKLRAIYLYTSAAQSRGKLPGSQAGVADMFNFNADHQDWWPTAYWFWNLRMQVAANMTSGAFEMNTPIFNLYQSNLANLEAWTTAKMSGRAGICVPEVMRFNGNGSYQGAQDSGASCDEAASPNYNALTITSGAEVALWVWQQYLLTGDKEFLTTNYPLMSEAAQFLLAYATSGADGLLHTIANAHETQWNVADPITDVAAMSALFPALISAAGILGTDSTLVAQLQSAIPKIPALPRTDMATHTQVLAPAADAAGQDVFALSANPTAPSHNQENLDLEPVWPYSLIGDNSGANTVLATRTFNHRKNVYIADWSFDSVQAARLGLSNDVANALLKTTEGSQAYINGMAAWTVPSNEPYVEQSGVTTVAINEALVQDYDGLLRIAPAWPAGWDVAGTVFIQGNSKVDVEVTGGSVVIATLEAGSSGSVNVRNPWTGQAAAVLDGTANTSVIPATTAATFVVPTTAGHWYAIVPAGAAASLPSVRVSGSRGTAPSRLGSVSMGL